jgi:hypothetical protein
MFRSIFALKKCLTLWELPESFTPIFTGNGRNRRKITPVDRFGDILQSSTRVELNVGVYLDMAKRKPRLLQWIASIYYIHFQEAQPYWEYCFNIKKSRPYMWYRSLVRRLGVVWSPPEHGTGYHDINNILSYYWYCVIHDHKCSLFSKFINFFKSEVFQESQSPSKLNEITNWYPLYLEVR